MNKDLKDLKENISNKIDQQFSQNSGVDQYFFHILDNVAYRYIEDDKYGPRKLSKLGDLHFSVLAKSHSMTTALKVTEGAQKADLVEAIKEAMKSERATSCSQIIINARELDQKGQGPVKITTLYNWDFPDHDDASKQIISEVTFESEDWEHLRTRFPLSVEEACDLFI